MRKFKNSRLLAAGLLILVLTLYGISRKPSVTQAQGPAPVTVVNTTANPVPVTGTDTGAIVLVRDTDNPARNVFKQFIRLGQTNPSSQQITVPAGQRIVMEYLSARGCVAAGQLPELVIFENDPISGAALGAYRFAPGGRINRMGGLDCFAFNQNLRAYADPGSVLTVAFNGTTASTTNFDITISGYQLSVP